MFGARPSRGTFVGRGEARGSATYVRDRLRAYVLHVVAVPKVVSGTRRAVLGMSGKVRDVGA